MLPNSMYWLLGCQLHSPLIIFHKYSFVNYLCKYLILTKAIYLHAACQTYSTITSGVDSTNLLKCHVKYMCNFN